MVVPAQLAMMLQNTNYNKYDLKSLRVFQVAGAPLPPHIAEEVETRFKCLVVNHYGGMDAGSLTSVSADDPVEVRRFSVGKAHPGNEIKLLDDNGKEVKPGEVGAVYFKGPTSVGLFNKDRRYKDLGPNGLTWRFGQAMKREPLYSRQKKGTDIIIPWRLSVYPAR